MYSNDITKKMKKKEHKRKNKHKKALVDFEDDGVEHKIKKFCYVLSPEGIIKYLSPDFSKLANCSDYMGNHFCSLIAKERKKELYPNDLSTIIKEQAEAEEDLINSWESELSISTDRIQVRMYEKPIIDYSFETSERGETYSLRRVKGIQGVCVLSDFVSEIEELEKEYCAVILKRSGLESVLIRKKTAESNYLLTEEICKIFEHSLQFLNPKNDKWLEKGRNMFVDQVLHYIERNLPIKFLVPAFPFKSGNHESKTLGHLPDKGEEIALKTIHKFCKQISKIYKYGVNFFLVSDGRVFADVMGILDETVDEYHDQMRAKFSKYTKFITFFDLAYFLDTKGTHDKAREKVLKLFGKSTENIQKQTESDPDYTKMYMGFSKFCYEDCYLVHDDNKKEKLEQISKEQGLSKTAIMNNVKKIAKTIMRRNDAYSQMLSTLLPLHVRLSIHAHDNSGPKFAIRLIPSDKVSEELVSDKNMHIPTPWHNVVVEDINGKYTLMKKYKVSLLKDRCELVHFPDGSVSHYRVIIGTEFDKLSEILEQTEKTEEIHDL